MFKKFSRLFVATQIIKHPNLESMAGTGSLRLRIQEKGLCADGGKWRLFLSFRLSKRDGNFPDSTRLLYR